MPARISIIPKNRLEAFSDGFLAIIITIMALEFRVPHGSDLSALRPMVPAFLSYVLSFIYLAIYWNNHHHLLHTAGEINGKIMWANSYLLFWLSVFPFATAWVGENHQAAWPTAVYGFICIMAATAYFILQGCIVESQGKNSVLARALGQDWKGRISLVTYASSIGLAFVNPWISDLLFVLVALLWLVPDLRLEKVMTRAREQG